MVREILFYKSNTGRSPVEDFLDTLSAKQAAKAAWVIQLVEEMDVVPTQYFQKMKNAEDLWEFGSRPDRTSSGSWDSSMVENWWCYHMHSRRRRKRHPGKPFNWPRNANEHTSAGENNE
jgi:hypothetical protein